MPTNNSSIKELLDRYLDGTADSNETAFVEDWLDQLQSGNSAWAALSAADRAVALAKLYDRIKTAKQDSKLVSFNIRKWISVAAMIIVMAVGAWIYFVKNDDADQPKTAKVENKIVKDVTPGKVGALLTTSDGKTISLDNLENGNIIEGVVKQDSSLNYEEAVVVQMHTLTTPYGRTYSVDLADGTKAWLNAGSSITYPTAFTKMTREVKITGEVYFEVAHDSKHPFIVKTRTDKIEVLGTHFNIRAYDEENVKTTLLQGKVKIADRVLQPGQQYANGSVQPVNTVATVAWVHGYFHFERASVQTLMREISRWYDVEVKYEGKISSEVFGGEMERNLNLSQVLKLVGTIGIHYELNGKQLIIRP
jgi:transmembrane sensor